LSLKLEASAEWVNKRLPQYIYPTSYLASTPGLIAASPAAATQAALAAQMQQAQMPQQTTHIDPYSGAAAAAAYAQAQAQYAASAGLDPTSAAYAASSPYAAAAAAQSPAAAAYFASAPGYAAGYAALPTTAASQSLAAAAFPTAYQQPQSQLQAAAGGDRV